MTLVSIALGILAASLLGVILDWILKPLLPNKRSLKIFFVGIVAIIFLVIISAWPQLYIMLIGEKAINVNVGNGSPPIPTNISDNPTIAYLPTLESSITPEPSATPVPTSPPTSTATPTPTSISVDLDHPNINIYMEKGETGVEIMLFAGGYPQVDFSVIIDRAVLDVAGNWRDLNSSNKPWCSLKLDATTGINGGTCEPGTYGITYLRWPTKGQNIVFGRWGLQKADASEHYSQIIPFEVISGMRTKIEIHLGIVRIVVLNSNNEVDYGGSLDIYCQTTNASGNYIASSDCPYTLNPPTLNGLTTDDGYRYLILGRGKYIVSFSSAYFRERGLLTNIGVGPDEILDITLQASENDNKPVIPKDGIPPN